MSDNFDEVIANLETQKASLRQPTGQPIFTPAMEAQKQAAITQAAEAAYRAHDSALAAKQAAAVAKIRELDQPAMDPVYSLRGDDLSRAAALRGFIESDIAGKKAAEIDALLNSLAGDKAALAVAVRALAAAEPGSLVDAIGLTQLRQKAMAGLVDKQAAANVEKQTAELRRRIGEIARQRAEAERRFTALAGRSRTLIAM
jgi:hypothetical protein